MRRTKEEAEQTRQEIFRAGLRVFSEKGFAAATLNDVARRAGVTRGAIYWHFKSKDSFIEEIMSRLSSYYDELVRTELDGDSLPASVRRFIIRLLNRFAADDEWRAMQEIILRSTLNRNNPGSSMRAVVNTEKTDIFGIFEKAAGKGEIYTGWDGETAKFCLASVISGAFVQLIEDPDSLNAERIEQVADFIVRGLKPAEDGKSCTTNQYKRTER